MRFQCFHAWEPIDQNTTADPGRFCDFLATIVACRFPENGIEYLEPPRESRGRDLADLVGGQVDHAAVYTHPGRCEGDILRVTLATRSREYIPIAFGKILASSTDEVWALTRNVAEVAHGMFLYEEQPMLPRLASQFVRLNQEPHLLDRPRDKTVNIGGRPKDGLYVSMDDGPTVRHDPADTPGYLFDALRREYSRFFAAIGCWPVHM